MNIVDYDAEEEVGVEDKNDNSNHDDIEMIIMKIFHDIQQLLSFHLILSVLSIIGIPLKRVSIVSDDVEEIEAEVRRMSQKYDVVFTSGGIGPTHDDVTLKAVAKALGQEIRLNQQMLAHLEEIQFESTSHMNLYQSDHNNWKNINDGGGGQNNEYDVNRQGYTTLSPSSLSSSSQSKSSSSLFSSIDDNTKRLAMLPEHSQLLFPPTPDDYFMRTITLPTTTINSTKQQINSKMKSDIDGAIDADTNDVDNDINDENYDTTNKNEKNIINKKKFRSKTWPVLQCDNIFVLPGIPQFYASKMHLIVKYFLQKNKKLEIRKIVLDLDEKNLVSILDVLVDQHKDVKFGSYPFVDHPEFKTIISIEGTIVQQVEDAVANLIDKLPSKMVVLRVEKESGVDIE